VKKIEELLDDNGFYLAREKNHRIFKRPDGLTVVLAKSPSDHRAYLNQVAQLARVLGKRKQELLVH
jgi:predicted RNA binding protein YcfA (HicA-like mRNA interferase family)